MKFKKVYSFQLEQEIKNGKDVWYADKQNKEIGYVNGVLLKDFFEMTNQENESRFEFWIEEQEDV